MADVINLLPDAIANQIAAGEVVQRPASVVKELLENAIDAGGSQIKLIIKDAGKTFIQVSDNGSGMSETDARMCFERHATSKINRIEDLFTILTFGFRGEAMASIGAVARVELKTKRKNDKLGTEVLVEDSRVKKHEPCSVPDGTSITVKNLFYNVPARKNFLKSDTVERRHINDEFVRVAMANPTVQLSYFNDNDELYHLTSGSLKQRIIQLFGKRYQEHLLDIAEDTEIIKISGFVAKPEMAKKTKGEQFFFANNRFIKSPYFNHAVQGAFEGLISSDNYPAYFIFFELNPARLDVNVHPTKTEVKFEDEKSIYAILKTTIKKILSQSNISSGLNFDAESQLGQANAFDDFMQRHSFIKPTNNPIGHQTGQISKSVTSTKPFVKDQVSKQSVDNWQQLYQSIDEEVSQKAESKALDDKLFDNNDEEVKGDAKPPFQIQRKYIVSSISSGLVVIHQRLAHQRILYEKYIGLIKEQASSSQQKLFPEVVQFTANEFAIVKEIEPQLLNMGFNFEYFGQNAILINGTPTAMEQTDMADIFQRFIAYYMDSEQTDKLTRTELMARSLAMSTCIETGTFLSVEAMQLLIDKLFACEMPYYNPDGKSTIITISTDELDKKFNNI